MDREALELFAHGAGGRAQAAVRAPHLATQPVRSSTAECFESFNFDLKFFNQVQRTTLFNT